MAAPSRWISHDFPTINRSPSRRAGERAIAADEADADMRRCFRQQFRRGVAKAALIEDEEVEAGEVWCDQGELLSQRSLRQAQRRTDDEPVRLGVEEHERAVVAPTGEIEAGNELQIGGRHVAPRWRRSENRCACGNRRNLNPGWRLFGASRAPTARGGSMEDDV